MLAPSIPVSVAADTAALDRAVLRTVAYSDVFDFPLRDVEVHRYLHGVRAPLADTMAALARCATSDGVLTRCDGYYTLRGREGLVETRQERGARALRVWPAALRYGRAIAGLPFVRHVAVTGSLAWDNVPPNADIDYLVVTEPGRLWIVRWLVALLGRFARQDGLLISPNHMVTKRALMVPERDLYVAYELAGMTPIAGLGTYRRLRRANAWTTSFLPNAVGEPRLPPVQLPNGRNGNARVLARLMRAGESVLRSRIGSAVEHYEMRYRIRKIMRYHTRLLLSGGVPPVATYGVDACRAYWGGHRPRALTRFAERLRSLEEGMV